MEGKEASLEVQEADYPVVVLEASLQEASLAVQDPSLEVQEASLTVQEASLAVQEPLEVPEAFQQVDLPWAVPALVVGARVLA